MDYSTWRNHHYTHNQCIPSTTTKPTLQRTNGMGTTHTLFSKKRRYEVSVNNLYRRSAETHWTVDFFWRTCHTRYGCQSRCLLRKTCTGTCKGTNQYDMPDAKSDGRGSPQFTLQWKRTDLNNVWQSRRSYWTWNVLPSLVWNRRPQGHGTGDCSAQCF